MDFVERDGALAVLWCGDCWALNMVERAKLRVVGGGWVSECLGDCDGHGASVGEGAKGAGDLWWWWVEGERARKRDAVGRMRGVWVGCSMRGEERRRVTGAINNGGLGVSSRGRNGGVEGM